MMEGWKCPVCGRGVAPTERHCEHDGGQTDVRTVRPGYDHFPALPSEYPAPVMTLPTVFKINPYDPDPQWEVISLGSA